MKLYKDDPYPNGGDFKCPALVLLVVVVFVGAIVSFFI